MVQTSKLCRFTPKRGDNYIYCPHPEETQTTPFCQACATMHVVGRLDKTIKTLEKIAKIMEKKQQ